MMPAATHFDPILGIDVHLIQPPGPVPPVPIPHPYLGIVFDLFDYAPIVGATVKVNGMYRAIAGSEGKGLPKHIPIGGTFVPPLPGNEDENFMGSATVEMDGDAAAYMGLPCLSCQSIGSLAPPRINPKKKGKVTSLVLPTSVVLPIPKGPPVLVGGPPTISLMGMAFKAIGPILGAIKRSKGFGRAAGAFKKARQKVFKNMPPGFIKCKVLKAEPVNVVTGAVVVDQQDFDLPGRIPIAWPRHYTSDSLRTGSCGRGWETPADARLELQPDGSVVFMDGTGTGALFDALPASPDTPVREPVDGWTLHRLGEHLAVRRKGGLTYYFPVPRKAAWDEILVDALVDTCRNSLHFLRGPEGLERVVESAGRWLEVVSRGGLIERIVLHHPDFAEARTLVRYGYDGNGNLTAVYDALDNPYTFGYAAGRMVRHTNRTGLSFYYEYDVDGRAVHAFGDGGLYDYHFEYDRAGCFTNYTDSLGHPWTVKYNGNDQIVRETDPLGGVTTYGYDAVGRTTEIVDPAGRATTYRYDDQGNLLELGRPDGTKIVTTYNGNGNPIAQIDAKGHAWRMDWDERGLLTSRASPRGGMWRYEHNIAGCLVAVTDPREACTQFQYDRLGSLTTIHDALGNKQHFALDPLGNVSRYTDGEGYNSDFSHDKKGRLLEICYPLGSRTCYGYDREDNLTSFTDQNQHTTCYRYFGLGELAERRQPDGTMVRYEYDTEERLIAVINERGQRYQLIRDQIGQVIEEIDYWANPKRHRYDAAGNVTESTDALSRTVRFTYDNLDRLLRHQFDDNTEETFAYDTNGNLTVAESSTIRVERVFDEDGNMIEERQGDFVIQYTYDLAGNRLLRRSGHGNHLSVTYDPLSRAQQISFNSRNLAHMSYDRRGLLTLDRVGPSLTRRYEHDPEQNLLSACCTVESSLVSTHRYRFDHAGNVLFSESNILGNATSLTMAYDPMDRVVSATSALGEIQHYKYDMAGDLLRHKIDASTSDHMRFASCGNFLYAFDRSGSLVQRSDSDGRTLTYEWDSLNRLIAVVDNSGQKTQFRYDALHRRVEKTSGGRTIKFTWDGDYLLSDTPLGGCQPREFMYRVDSFEPIACASGNILQLINSDVRNLPSETFTEFAEITSFLTYDALARPNTGGSSAAPFGLSGQYVDDDCGLNYNRFRYYDPFSVSYISQDPLGLAAGENLYAYAPNVWTWFDPLGLSCEITYRNPGDINLSHPASLSTPFSNSKHGTVNDLAQKLRSGDIKPEDIPAIEVAKIRGQLYSANNRRLRAFQEAGVNVPTIPASREQARKIKQRLQKRSGR
ncbi:RHS repeat-associated protein [Skermanella aerolata]|uniref:DUF6531 domain-containing protein n=1 Tax=Skermanella aerolata TaxID=393310 RepID=UPI003D203DB4